MSQIIQPAFKFDMEIKMEPVDEEEQAIIKEGFNFVIKHEEETFTITEIMEQEMKVENLDEVPPFDTFMLIKEEHNYSKSYYEEESTYMESDEDGILFEEVNELTTAYEDTFKPPNRPFDLSLKCPECPMILEDTLRLNRHKKIHIAPKFQCNTCLKRFKRKSSLTKHFCDLQCSICEGICECPLISDPSTCKICLKIMFRYFDDYKLHMLQYHNEIIFCKVCQSMKNTFFKHKQQNHALVKHYRCPNCLMEIECKEMFANHLKNLCKFI